MKKKVCITLTFLLIICCAFSLTSCIDDIIDGRDPYQYFDLANMEEVKSIFGSDKIYPYNVDELEKFQVGAPLTVKTDGKNYKKLTFARFQFTYTTDFGGDYSLDDSSTALPEKTSYIIKYDIHKLENFTNNNYAKEHAFTINGFNIIRQNTPITIFSQGVRDYVLYTFDTNDMRYSIYCDMYKYDNGDVKLLNDAFNKAVHIQQLEQYFKQYLENLLSGL